MACLVKDSASCDLGRSGDCQSAKQRASLIDNRQQILMSKQLVILDSKLPIDVAWDSFKVQPPDRSALMPLLKELEFTGLIKEYLPAEAGPVISGALLRPCQERSRPGRCTAFAGSAAGPDDETHGVYGSITPAPRVNGNGKPSAKVNVMRND